MEKVVDFPTRQVRDIATIKRHLDPSLRAAGVSAHEEAQLFSALKPFLDALEGFNDALAAISNCAALPPGEVARLDILLHGVFNQIFAERMDRELGILAGR